MTRMNNGELLTRGTIWVSLVGYTLGSITFSTARGKTRWDSATRVTWSIACISMIAHFASAFQFYHGWSHAAAYADTARQTEEVFGLNWGGGLFINYAILSAWMVDIAWWWHSGLASYRKRPMLVLAVWHGLFIFIIFNATVVFGHGIARWFGLLICALLTSAWWRIVTSPAPLKHEH